MTQSAKDRFPDLVKQAWNRESYEMLWARLVKALAMESVDPRAASIARVRLAHSRDEITDRMAISLMRNDVGRIADAFAQQVLSRARAKTTSNDKRGRGL